MTCPEIQNRLLQLDPLPAAERLAVAAHVAACGECREFAARWRRLDNGLARQLQPPTLSVDFETRLWRRIGAEGAPMSEARRSERRRAIEDDFGARCTQLRRHAGWLGGLLDGLGYGVLGVLVLALLSRYWPGVASVLSAQTASVNSQAILAGLAAAACVGAGCVVAFRRQAGRLLASVI